MPRVIRKVVTVQEGGLVQVRVPGLPTGALADVSIQVEESKGAAEPDRAPKDDPNSLFSDIPPAAGASNEPRRSLPVADPSEYLIPEVAPPPVLEPDTDIDDTISRQKLLVALATSDMGRMEHRVAFILQNYPDTRDDDIALLIRYYEEFQANVLENWTEPTLDVLYDLDNAGTILRLRRHIQNDLSLFVGTLRTRWRRKEITQQFYKYLSEKRAEDAEVRIYLDETKGDPGSRYVGIAGICVIDWRQYEKFYAVIAQWRTEQGWPETLHFSSQAQRDITRHLALLGQLQKCRAGLLFVGHDMATRAVSHRTLTDLFVQLTVGCLRKLSEDGCLGTRRSVVLVKEAEEGYDRLHLDALNRELSQQLAYEFADAAYLGEIKAVPKGREVFLELADLIAAGMQRRALYGGWQAKDELAEAVANVTGFEDSAAKGVVYRNWYREK